MAWRRSVLAVLCVQAIATGAAAGAAPPTVSVMSSVFKTEPDRYYSLLVMFSDPDGDALDLRIENLPSWAKFWSSRAGAAYFALLYGTPSGGDVGTYGNIRFLASDGSGTVASAPLAITVGAPAIELLSSNFATLANNYFTVLAVAHHAPGKTLGLRVDNAPAWAKFWSYRGSDGDYMLLYGTPAIQDIGVYSDVRFVATDGSTTEFRTLEIAVAVGSGSTFTLSWLRPTENEDGSALLDLAGYRLHIWAAQQGAATSQIVPLQPSLTQLQVGQMRSGLWRFAMTAYDSTGAESVLSPILPVLVTATAP